MVIVLWYSLIFYSVLSTAFSLFIKERYHDPELEGKSELALLACIQYIDDITTCSHREDEDPSSDLIFDIAGLEMKQSQSSLEELTVCTHYDRNNDELYEKLIHVANKHNTIKLL